MTGLKNSWIYKQNNIEEAAFRKREAAFFNISIL